MPVISIANGTIIEVSSEGDTTFVTITYLDEERNEQTVRLVAGAQTIVLGTNGIPVPATILGEGMTVSATFSSTMTRSIPPQATAYIIVITAWPLPEDITQGTILNVDRRNRSFILINERDFSTVIQFNVPENTVILGRFGRPMDFSNLIPGMRVQVRHANFMTASIPPQTTAFEIQVL